MNIPFHQQTYALSPQTIVMDSSNPPHAQNYLPLSDGCIRLLSIQPSANRDDKIECALSPARNEEGNYEALSYVWGPDSPSYNLLVDGQEVHVRANLYQALKELRLKEQPRVLWVDSICINQADINERNRQVKQMGSVYSCAREVIVWLGEGDVETGVALDFIHRLSNLNPLIARRIVENNGLTWKERLQVFGSLGMHHGHDDYKRIVGGLTKLMNHSWWTRVWTLQEIVLSRSASLRCGSKSAYWTHLVKLATFALEVSHHNTLSAFGRPMVEAIFDEWTIQLLRLYVASSVISDLSYRLDNGLVSSLEQMILQMRLRQATEPLDAIYALLGLTAEKATIEIDYGKRKNEVYKAAMKAMLENDRAGHTPLHLLQDSYLQRDPTLPSWVPEFSILHSLKTSNLSVSGIGATLVLNSCLYNASLGDNGWSPPKFLDDDDVLQMEGVLVDEVTNLGEVCPRFEMGRRERDAQLQAIIEQWRKVIPEKIEHYPAGGTAIEAFWRTITFDLLLLDREYFAGNPNRRDNRLPRGSTGMPPKTEHDEAEIREGILDAPVPKTILEKLSERRFFVTKAGYMGLGPASTKAGDIVCVLRGCLFPTLCRPATADHYTMVGECFVHGIMDGEMINSVKEEIYSWQNFSFV